MTAQELTRIAAKLARVRPLPGGSCATVAAALHTQAGNVFTGICVDLRCSLGFCAERAAAAEMLKGGETQVTMMVAVDSQGDVVPPCGACREFLAQLDAGNCEAQVVMGAGTLAALGTLLPHR